ncbi:MAG: type IV pilus modification protein PilV [Gammaproteobacteria bacterium]|nr:type IV pilus modification protein PilV [Gammaproteobacteria bacterium]
MMTPGISFSKARLQRGFSLVEVLIALIIMSVGMLGIASLYVQSMQAGRTSLFRHNAVTLAGDVADRIRANPTAVGAYELAGQDFSCTDGTTTCSNTQMAAHDVLLWGQQAQDTLPNGNVTVVVNQIPNPPVYTITVAWDEPGQAQNYAFATPIPTF